MRRATLKEHRAELERLAGQAGCQVGDPVFLAQLNKAMEEIMNAGDFAGVVDRFAFRTYDGLVTLPADLERPLGVSVDSRPVEIKSPWYEFMQHGPGVVSEFTGANMILDRGEAATFRDIPETGGPYRLRVKARVSETVNNARPKIRILGYDESGNWVRTEDVNEPFDGIDVEINGDTAPRYVETLVKFSHVEAVIKPLTKSYVELWAVSDTAPEFMIASYAPREKTPSYRRFFLPNISPTASAPAVVVMRVRRRFFPVADDNDFLPISNINALESMMQALQSRENKDADGYLKMRTVALSLMKEETEAYRGEDSGPAITFMEGIGLGDIEHVQ